MKLNAKTEKRINLLTNVIIGIVAILSLVIALISNKKADEANRIAKEANRIADIGGTASITLTKAHLASYGIMYCVEGSVYSYWLYVEPTFLFTNTGGKSVSLIDFNAYRENSGWGFFNGYWEKGIELELTNETMRKFPVDIQPGVSKEFQFVNTYLVRKAKSADELKDYISNNTNISVVTPLYQFRFGNGQLLSFDFDHSFNLIEPSTQIMPCEWPFFVN